MKPLVLMLFISVFRYSSRCRNRHRIWNFRLRGRAIFVVAVFRK